MKHILRSQQFDKPALEELFKETDRIRSMYGDRVGRLELMHSFPGSLIFLVFYEPSSRTRFSFCAAAHYLGITSVWTEDASKFSSAIKGETIEDTIHALCQYDPAAIVIRHTAVGTAEKAASIVDRFQYDAAIINAGDGTGQHPTQALLDLYTIEREIGRLDDITVTVSGDLANGRTVRSLVYLLSKFEKVRFMFLSPKNLRMRADIIEHLEERRIPFNQTQDLNTALRSSDIFYQTRIQKERGSVDDETLDLSIGMKEINLMKPHARLLHPLPRVDEIDTEVDNDPRSAYFRQIKNGKFIRMALLKGICERSNSAA